MLAQQPHTFEHYTCTDAPLRSREPIARQRGQLGSLAPSHRGAISRQGRGHFLSGEFTKRMYDIRQDS